MKRASILCIAIVAIAVPAAGRAQSEAEQSADATMTNGHPVEPAVPVDASQSSLADTPPADEPLIARELRDAATGDQGLTIGAGLVLPRDTPIHLMVISEVTTKTHAAGHRFRLRVNEPVVVDGIELVPVGATAWGQLTSASGSGNLGKSGSLEAELLYLELGEQRIAIEGRTSDEGNSGTAETVMGVLGLGIFGLFAKGNNARIKAGEKITAFTREDTLIERRETE